MYAWRAISDYGEFCGLTTAQIQEMQTVYLEIFSNETECEFFDQCIEKLTKGELLPDELTSHYPDTSLPKIHLLLILSLYPFGRKRYQQQNWPLARFNEAISDVAIWIKHHEENFGSTGLSWRSVCWDRRIFCALTIQLGRLQCDWTHHLGGNNSVFRNRNTGETIITKESLEAPWECLLAPGDPVINLHIPASGPLDIDACRDSLRQMTLFFDQYRPEYHYRAAVCYSWFLDRQLQDILPADSNIIRFQQLGHVFDCHEDSDAIWRVFGEKGISEGIDAVPHKTKLQKCLAEFINRGGQLRSGGIFILKDEII